MQIDHPETRCEHPGCSCAVGAGEHFCSDHCRQAAQTTGVGDRDTKNTCACGHPECD